MEINQQLCGGWGSYSLQGVRTGSAFFFLEVWVWGISLFFLTMNQQNGLGDEWGRGCLESTAALPTLLWKVKQWGPSRESWWVRVPFAWKASLLFSPTGSSEGQTGTRASSFALWWARRVPRHPERLDIASPEPLTLWKTAALCRPLASWELEYQPAVFAAS